MSTDRHLTAAANVIESNGFYRHYLWDTNQAAAGTPPEYCRVDIAGALAVALHGSPSQAFSLEVRQVENLLVERVSAPSLVTWYSHPGVDQQEVLRLLRRTAIELRTQALRDRTRRSAA